MNQDQIDDFAFRSLAKDLPFGLLYLAILLIAMNGIWHLFF
jgi:hypothetical protein